MTSLSARTIRPVELQSWTGLRPQAFLLLATRLWEAHPDRGGRHRPWTLSRIDRVLLLTLALRTNLTYRQLGSLFGVSVAVVHRVLHDLAPAAAGLLEPTTDRRELWVVDGTLVPVHDHRRSAKSKNYRRSANIQVVVRARDRRVVAVGVAWPGNRNDSVVYRETVGKNPAVQAHPRVSGDGGYRGVDGVRSPRRGKDRRIIRDRAYKRFARRRAVAEHTLARLKDWQILRQHRMPAGAIDVTATVVAVLHNLNVETSYAM